MSAAALPTTENAPEQAPRAPQNYRQQAKNCVCTVNRFGFLRTCIFPALSSILPLLVLVKLAFDPTQADAIMYLLVTLCFLAVCLGYQQFQLREMYVEQMQQTMFHRLRLDVRQVLARMSPRWIESMSTLMKDFFLAEEDNDAWDAIDSRRSDCRILLERFENARDIKPLLKWNIPDAEREKLIEAYTLKYEHEVSNAQIIVGDMNMFYRSLQKRMPKPTPAEA